MCRKHWQMAAAAAAAAAAAVFCAPWSLDTENAGQAFAEQRKNDQKTQTNASPHLPCVQVAV
jgi:hypothetical protein